MTDRKKKLLLALLSLLAAAVTLITGYVVEIPSVDVPTPTPSPSLSASPSPSPSVTPSPSPSASPSASPMPSPTTMPSPSPAPSVTPTPTSGVDVLGLSLALVKPEPPMYALETTKTPVLSLLKGETTGRVASLNVTGPCAPIGIVTPDMAASVQVFRMIPVKTTRKSHTLAVLGDHYDPLIPISEVCPSDKFVFVDVTGLKPGMTTVQFGNIALTVKVAAQELPAKPSVPFYMGLGSWALMRGHNLESQPFTTVQGPLAAKYAALLRAHRIEPYAQYVVGPLSGLDTFKTDGASFRQLVVDGALASPMVIPPAHIGDAWPSAAQLSQYNAMISAEPTLKDAWAYVVDEVPDADLPGLKTRLDTVRANAPLLKTVVTREPVAGMLSLVDHWVPIFEYFKRSDRWQDYAGMNFWIYGACPSHGSCSNGTLGTLTGTPDLMLDIPTAHAIAYPQVAAAVGAKASLYYNAVEAYGLKMDPWVDQYLFGGNGDGQLVYQGVPGVRGFTEHTAVGSIRLKAIREGMNLLEHGRLTGKSLVRSQFDWPKDVKTYEGMRVVP